MKLEDYIDLVAEGKDLHKVTNDRRYHSRNHGYMPNLKQFGIGYARGVKTSGLLSLYFRGELYTSKLIGSRFERTKVMQAMLSRLGKLEGDRYFLWVPEMN
jgi:hypothetical protein